MQDVLWAQRPDGVFLTIDLNEAQDIKAEVGDEELLWFISIHPLKTSEHVKCKIRFSPLERGWCVKFRALCCAADSRKKITDETPNVNRVEEAWKEIRTDATYVVKSITVARSALQNRCH